MARRRWTAAAAVVAALVAIGGCARPAVVEVPVNPPVSEPPVSSPADPPVERPQRTTSVDLPRLPVGGDSQSVSGHPGRSCVSVSWIVDPAGPGALQPGIEIAVRGVRFEPAGFELVRGSCLDGVRACVGYTFSAASPAPACSIAAWTDTPGATAAVLLTGRVRCREVPAHRCAAFVAAAAGEPSQLQITDERPPTAPEPSPEPTPTDTGGG